MQNQKGASDSKKQCGRWSKEEHERFMLGLMQYGKNWKKVQEIVGTRSGSQVRSHAQKFFNKIQKSTKQPKGSKNKRLEHGNQENNQQDISLTDNNDIIRSYDQDNSMATPLQIISLIKKQSVDNRKVNLSSFKKSLEENQEKHNLKFSISNKNPNFNPNTQSFLNQTNNKTQTPANNPASSSFAGLNSFKSMNNILSAYEALNQTGPQNRYEDESFLIGLTKKYKRFFSKGGQFQNLIDFGNPHQVAKAAQMEKSIRKKSWTLPEGIQGDQNDLEDIKKRLKQNKNQNVTSSNKIQLLKQPSDSQKKEKSQQKLESKQSLPNKQPENPTQKQKDQPVSKQKQSITQNSTNQKTQSKEQIM